MIKEKSNTIINEDTQLVEKVELVFSGEDYFSRLRSIIANAKTEIHLQTYIFENDSTGIEITNALKEAALRKVKVYVLLDAYGSFSLTKQCINDLLSFSEWNHGIISLFYDKSYSRKVSKQAQKISVKNGDPLSI